MHQTQSQPIYRIGDTVRCKRQGIFGTHEVITEITERDFLPEDTVVRDARGREVELVRGWHYTVKAKWDGFPMIYHERELTRHIVAATKSFDEILDELNGE